MSVRVPMLAAGLALVAPGCIASNVVASSGRAVQVADARVEWRAARAEDFDGLFESQSIEGEVAASLARIEYNFSADGVFTGAALVLGGAHPEFQTLSGRWTLSGDVLDFGEGRTARVRAASGMLELSDEGGVVVLKRAEMR